MSFLVSVAVLPVQISVTVPIISQAFRFLTNSLSPFIVSIENANERDTARGRPSGTATIMMATAMVKISMIFSRVKFESSWVSENMTFVTRWMDIAQAIRKPAKYPHLPNSLAILSSLCYRGESSSVESIISSSWVWAICVYFPTEQTTAFPHPERTRLLLSRKASGFSRWFSP